MYLTAAHLGMPAKWVHARHDITHGHIPELRVLESLIKPALEWLWYGFWVHFCSAEEEKDDGEEVIAERNTYHQSENAAADKVTGQTLKNLISQYSSLRESEIDHDINNSEAITTCQLRLIETCGNDVIRLGTAATILMDDGFMLQSPEQ